MRTFVDFPQQVLSFSRFFSRFLHHQFKAQLRRRALQIQEELEFDREILKMLQAEEERRQEAETERNKKAKADVQWMKEVIKCCLS